MPTIAEAFAIANACYQAGRLTTVDSLCRKILLANPNHVDALHLLGLTCFQLGELVPAVEYIRRAIELDAKDAAFHCNLGNVLLAQGKQDQAIGSYRQALELNPLLSEAHCNLGNAFYELGELDQAVACFRRAMQLNPGNAETNYNLGNTLRAQEKLDEAVECYHRALELKPDYVVALNNLGGTLQSLGKMDEAITAYRRALELKPDYADATSNLGTALRRSGRFSEASRCYAKALDLMPDCPSAHYARSIQKLLHGDFEGGWREYEWRWQTNEFEQRSYSQPKWEGEQLGDRTLLLHTEQGLGDTIQFVRYAIAVKKQNPNATILLECQRPLKELLSTCSGIDQLIAAGGELPQFDVYCPLLSLSRIFNTTLQTISRKVPYLFADEELVHRWREELRSVDGDRRQVCSELKIGINWRGRGIDRQRHIPLGYFAALGQLPGVRLISLQKGAERIELAKLGIWDPGDELDTTAAFRDTAAIMKNVELVLSCDTSIAHLAGALGVPVWVALPFVPDWRWLLDRSDSPWYPTMRLFRQKEPGDWAGVFEEIAGALRERFGC